jgi:hypothetical protein
MSEIRATVTCDKCGRVDFIHFKDVAGLTNLKGKVAAEATRRGWQIREPKQRNLCVDCK